jgi:hypothetical protein
VDYSLFNNNGWNHVVVTFDGNATTGRCIYANGVKLTGTLDGSSSGTALSLTNNTQAIIGAFHRTSQNDYIHEIVGKISNFKLYSVALEPSEVQKLYRLGRTGRSMVISDTAVGIGKAPEAQLDVRGVIRGVCPAMLSVKANASMLVTVTGSNAPPAVFGDIILDTAGGWDSTNNRYYAKVPGYYWVYASEFVLVVTNSYVTAEIQKNGVRHSFNSDFGSYPRVTLGALVHLDLDDYVRVLIGSDGGAGRTSLSAHRLDIIHIGM